MHGEALKLAQIARPEVRDPAAWLDKPREPLKGLNPQFIVRDAVFRR